MLVSRRHNIAFAHYPKTAGCSFARWFCQVFPDAAYVPAADPHIAVRPSLENLGLVSGPPVRSKVLRKCLSGCRKILPLHQAHKPCGLRIIGVVREPFEMLVSLYEYWRRTISPGDPAPRLIRVACTKSFRTFVELAVVGQRLPNYEAFFDVGGPAWGTTRLLDFATLDGALTAACEELGIQASTKLGLFNSAPKRMRAIRDYALETGDLMREVRAYYRWYYEEADYVMLHGARNSSRRAA
jgi:hypothetical protein